MIDLDVWFDANNPVDGPNWTLGDVTGISDTGWVSGIGSFNDGPGGLADGNVRAYLLDARALLVPEPAAISGVSLLMAVGALRRGRRR
jgi:hypothetical protein